MRARVKVQELMPLPKAFHVRTAGIFSSMVTRFATKKDKNGRVIRHGRLVPFTLDDLRAWVLEKLGGKPDGCGLCHYCNRPLTAEDFRLDHMIPPRRGGSLGLENLAFACDDDNRAKGGLTESEYNLLREMLDKMLESGALGIDGHKDVWTRLKGQNIILDAWHRKKKKQAEGPSGQLALEEPF
jgi:hypothetical protein